jgi:hypothetical protein
MFLGGSINYRYYNIGDEGYHHSSGKLQILREILREILAGSFFILPLVSKDEGELFDPRLELQLERSL